MLLKSIRRGDSLIKIDTHIHSHYSVDSNISIESICIKAIEKGMKVICITDHVDWDRRDAGFEFYNSKKYFEELNFCKKHYGNKLEILSGIEFSEPHKHKKELSKLSKLNYDMIMGSMHWLDEGFIGDSEVVDVYTVEEIELKYYKLVLEAVKFGGFNTLGHLDLPKRYLHKESQGNQNLIDKILKELINQNIALEINTSSIRKGYFEYMPSETILDRYIELGGSKLTFGSDAHNVEDILNSAEKIPLKFQKFIGYYKKGQFI